MHLGMEGRTARTAENGSGSAVQPEVATAQTSPTSSESAPSVDATAAAARPSVVELVGVTKVYTEGADPAVSELDLNVFEGEFFSLLGPSGSGKTTTLRMIAGFERPTVGRVRLGGGDV